MINRLKELNPDLEIYDVNSSDFLPFGRIIRDINTDEIIKVAEAIEKPAEGSIYVPSEEKFEFLDIAGEIENKCFGTLPSQIGYCFGHSNFLNATEWHASSEINIAVTPLVLMLAHIWDIKDGKIDSSEFKAFYLPKGTMVEVYSTSLHFCPCEVQKEGFGCVVALPDGTNTSLDIEPDDKMLFRKNKWIIAHNENKPLIERGVIAGISGENYKINY